MELCPVISILRGAMEGTQSWSPNKGRKLGFTKKVVKKMGLKMKKMIILVIKNVSKIRRFGL